MPCQIYLSCVPESTSSCCTSANMEKFSLFSASFERSAFSADYDSWTYVDTFDRSKIYKSLLASYKAFLDFPPVRSVRMEEGGAPSVPDESAIKVPTRSQRKKTGCSSSSVTSASKKHVLKTSMYICIYVLFETVNFVDLLLSCLYLLIALYFCSDFLIPYLSTCKGSLLQCPRIYSRNFLGAKRKRKAR